MKHQGSEINRVVGILREHLSELAHRYRLKSLGVFGSYVRGEQSSGSDLDLLVEFSEPPSLIQFLSLEHELSQLLGMNVDLVMKDALKPAIGQHILREVVPV